MEQKTFTTEQVVAGMAVLKTIIERLVEIKRCDELHLTTEAVAAGLYGMTATEFTNCLVECGFAIKNANGDACFNEGIDPEIMGWFDKENNTYVWTNIGIELAVMSLSNAGVYPGDKFVRLFIGNADAKKIIDNYVKKTTTNKNKK